MYNGLKFGGIVNVADTLAFLCTYIVRGFANFHESWMMRSRSSC